jgi:hypothetical protein
MSKNKWTGPKDLNHTELEKMEEYGNHAGVYVITANQKFPRVCGESDIMYFGSAGRTKKDKGVVGRLWCHLPPKEWPSAKYHEKGIGKELEELKRRCPHLKFSFRYRFMRSKEAAEREETRLIEEYRKKHLELPPYNLKE